MATRPGHPSTHGHHIDPYTCGRNWHVTCSGFSGGYDTYVCGCCCHDLHTDPKTVTDGDRRGPRVDRTGRDYLNHG